MGAAPGGGAGSRLVGRSWALRKNSGAERCRLRNCRQRSEEPGPGTEPGREESGGGGSSSKQRQRDRQRGVRRKSSERGGKKLTGTSVKSRVMVMMMSVMIAIKEENERLLIEERKI